MEFDDARSWTEREREVLGALEREFRGHRFRLPPPVHEQAAVPWWSRLFVSFSLLSADGLVLAAAVQAGAPALYLVAALLFPLAFLPYLRPGRAHRSTSPRGPADDLC